VKYLEEFTLTVIAMILKFLCKLWESAASAKERALVMKKDKSLFQIFFLQLRGHGL
jgi:hypothetical protein